ncbi:MAG: L-seryl-tRNA(Ser) seleniumtransferase [Candidatus Paceibacteria bacterium]|jgi:L-seryl-tRNA(Ser) seleniumtransferase
MRKVPIARSRFALEYRAIMSADRKELESAFRQLPGVDEALRLGRVARIAAKTGRSEVASLVRRALEGLRREIAEGKLDAAGLAEQLGADEVATRVEALFSADRKLGLQRVINVSGVVLNTGLGRAPVHLEVASRMAMAAASFCVLEVERASGKRNQRDDHLSRLLSRLTGCEAAIAVNNNAAAVFLCLQTFGQGGEAIVSRGELVEIGGSFRVPDVMVRAGVDLVEVGTTNRTRKADYSNAITPRTGLLMKVHTSNFKVIGFTEELSMQGLADLGSESGLPTVFDLGSGLFEQEGLEPLGKLGDETVVHDAVASGIDVVSFSGDKLFGGPQAGLIVGKREHIERLRKNPIYRALRLDKSTLCGLEGTLQLILDGRGDEIPTRRMLRLTADELKPVAEALAQRIDALPGFEAEACADQSQPGSGSAPDVFLDTWVVRVQSSEYSVEALARRLRMGEPSVFARVQSDRLLCDPRTLLHGDEDGLLEAFKSLATESSENSTGS